MKRFFSVLLLCVCILSSACLNDNSGEVQLPELEEIDETLTSDPGEAVEVTTGPVLQKDGLVYFTSPKCSPYILILYKMRTDGKEIKALTLINAEYCALPLELAIDGEWIYYYASEGSYKINTTSYERIKISSHIGRFHEGWIYYVSDSGLYKMSTDGTQTVMLTDMDAGPFWIYEDLIYFILKPPQFYDATEEDFKPGFFRIRTDGTQLIKLSDDRPSEVFFTGEWIYYNYGYGKWRRMKTNGMEKTELPGGAEILQVLDEQIIIRSEREVYAADLDGSNRKKLNISSYDLQVADEWIYYTEDSMLHKVKLDGTGNTKLNNEEISSFYTVGNWIYYYRRDDYFFDWRLCRMKLDGSQAGPIIP